MITTVAEFRHRRLLETLLPECVSPFVTQRLNGIIRDLDAVEQSRLTSSSTHELIASSQKTVPVTEAIRADRDPSAGTGKRDLQVDDAVSSPFEIDACNLSSTDQILLRRAIERLVGDSIGVRLRELKRGFSGSDVYLVKIKKAREGGSITMPKSWVAKIGDAHKLKQEYTKAQEACTLSTAHATIYEDFEARGCLLQEFASTSLGDDKTTSLRTALAPPYRQRNEERKIAKLLKYLGAVHDEIRVRTQMHGETRKSVIEATKICDGQIKLERLEYRLKIIGISSNVVHINNKFRMSLVSPLWYLSKLRTEQPSITYYEQHVHGDLHTENIQIDSNDVAHTIDWGNFGEGHSSIDYALLEASVWAHCASHDLLIEELDAALREVPFPGEEGSLEIDPVGDDVNPLARCKAVAKRIRSHAHTALHDPKPLDYAIGLFFCAVQQLQYEDANLRAMLVLANHAIERLDEEWGYIHDSANELVSTHK